MVFKHLTYKKWKIIFIFFFPLRAGDRTPDLSYAEHPQPLIFTLFYLFIF